jgi:acid phosphatase type 7
MQMKEIRLLKMLGLLLLGLIASSLQAQAGEHPSVTNVVAGVIDRMLHTFNTNELNNITVQKVESFLTLKEREVLANEHVTFQVNVPVRVSVLHDVRLGDDPFWLRERGFAPTGVTAKEGSAAYEAWQKDFEAGPIGLGVHSLSGGGNHYLVLLKPRNPGDKIEVTNLYPDFLRTVEFKGPVEPYVDQADILKAVPPELEGQLLIRTYADSEEDAKLVNIFRWTPYVATKKPDQVVLTWSEDPRTTQTIQWRTSTRVRKGYVQFQKKSDCLQFKPRKPLRAKAVTTDLSTPLLLNDPLVCRHTALLRGLAPGTTYVYSVGDGSAEGWTELAEFTTAPEGARPFSFIYMGDAQNGLDRWGTLVHNAFRTRPDAAFYIMAGDIVNRGAERNDWDSLFHNAEGVYDRRPVVPAIGNHECQGDGPRLFLEQFALPHNGPRGVSPERAYSFEYGNCLFIVLDSNLAPTTQTAWLEETLSKTKATWKFAVYHHPAYSSGGNSENPEVRSAWTPIFDKYHLDFALQGHDHAYLRTYPLKGGSRVASPKEGTTYIISVSGTKGYEQGKHDYTEFGMTHVPTYQALDIQISGNRLVYRAYDIDGKQRDELVIEK